MVVVDELVALVVVDAPGGGLVVVVLVAVVGVLVVVDVLVDVVVEVVDVGAGVVVVVGDGDGDGDGVKMSCTLVPVPWLPKMAESGCPEISSIPVMNRRAITNTMAAVPAIVCQLNDRRAPGRPSWVGPAVCIGTVVASIRSVAGAPPAGALSAAAEISRRSVSSPDAVDVDGDVDGDEGGDGDGDGASPDESASPVATVEPSLRSRGDESGARTTTCLTAC